MKSSNGTAGKSKLLTALGNRKEGNRVQRFTSSTLRSLKMGGKSTGTVRAMASAAKGLIGRWIGGSRKKRGGKKQEIGRAEKRIKKRRR